MRLRRPNEHDNSAGPLQVGQIVDERFEILGVHARGGMGAIFHALHLETKTEVLLKTLDLGRATENAVRRFQQEAKALCSLNHPNIVSVYNFGMLDNVLPYLAMELLQGEDLSKHIKRVGMLTWNNALPMFIQLSQGLAFAHERGVIHRDVKPSNIMLLLNLNSRDLGSVKLVDFGIAKIVDNAGGALNRLTGTGEIVGSPLYMSPEQCMGGYVDHRTDIYSLGCVLFEALTGAPPCIGENAVTTMMKHVTEDAPTLREGSLGADFPDALEAIVAKMLEKKPDQRYQNFSCAAQELSALIA